MFNNNFYNQRDSNVYTAFDDISGINFINNIIDKKVEQSIVKGFEKTQFSQQKWDAYGWPVAAKVIAYQSTDSLQRIAKKRLGYILPKTTGASYLGSFKNINAEAEAFSGANWFNPYKVPELSTVSLVNCKTAEDIYVALDNDKPVIIQLATSEYHLNKPLLITKNVQIIGNRANMIKFTSGKMVGAFIISQNGNLSLKDLSIDGTGLQASHFICSDSSGYSDHYNFSILNCSFQDFGKENNCKDLFYAYRHTLADSIIIHNNVFMNNACNFFTMNDEKEDKGYYNAEKIFISHNRFIDQSGSLLHIYRGGVDESTLGPHLIFSHNKLENCNNKGSLIQLTGVQQTEIFSNSFSDCNSSGDLISYEDLVRAKHYLGQNKISNSGKIEKNKYVEEK